MILNVCKSCGEPIFWAHTTKGKRIPIDLAPVDGGNIELDPLQLDPLALIVKPEPNRKRFVSHFPTCEEAEKWRR